MAPKNKGIIVGYGRKSREEKNNKAVSLDSQKARCREYAQSKGCNFVYFEDNNKTGDNLNRPGYKDMIAFIKSNKVECIVVFMLDRLTRNMENYFGTIQPIIRKYNTTIASTEQHFDDIFELEPMLLAVYLGISAQEQRNTKKRYKAVAEYRRKNGYVHGVAPIGYINTRDKDNRGIIEPDPNKAHYIKRIFELYATGMFSMERVGKEIAKYGFKNSQNKPYPKKRIEDILKNPVYMGKIGKGGRVPDDNDLISGVHTPIVSEELFNRVKLICSDTKKTRSHNEQYTYSNYIKCAKCGYSMVGILKHGGHNSGDYIYYHCSNYKKSHPKEKNIKQEYLDEVMQEVLESFDISEFELKKIKKLVFDALDDLQEYELKSINELKRQYDKVVNSITSTIKEENLNTETRKEIISKLQVEKDEITRKIDNLSASSKDTTTRLSILVDYANRLPELYLKASVQEKRLILTTITDSIIYDEDRNTLTVKLKPVFEQLRQRKLKEKQEYTVNLQVLTGTLETRSEKAKQSLKNMLRVVNKNEVYGTRQRLFQSKIEPLFETLDLKFVDGGT